MPKQTLTKNDDIEINQIALSTARFQDVARSWMNSAFGPEDSSTNKDKLDELEIQPESEGVGYVSRPADHLKKQSPATEALRKQMLGKRAKNLDKRTPKALTASKPKPTVTKRKDSDDEEEGRSGLGKSRKKFSVSEEMESQSHSLDNAGAIPSSKHKKRGTSYLDEVLAQRTTKKNRN